MLDSTKVRKISTGYFFWDETGTRELPATVTRKALEDAGFTNLGHTSLEDIMIGNAEGGERSTLGSLQDKNLRVDVAAKSYSYTVKFHQWDEVILKLAFGGNAKVEEGKVFIPETSHVSRGSWVAVFEDGNEKLFFYAKRCSAIGEAAPGITNTTSLTELPVVFTPQKPEGEEHIMVIGS